jgi:hypothetical protein
METCYYRATGRLDDYSEQQLIDCAYAGDWEGANGCEPTDGLAVYLNWIVSVVLYPANEEQYPYLYGQPADPACPDDLPHSPSLAALPLDYFSTGRGNESLLQNLVFMHGAVISAVKINENFINYKEGIFDDCDKGVDPAEADHAVTVVGYAWALPKEGGQPYWLIKNSWGVSWGEAGYMRMLRGVGMCGIGRHLAGLICEAIDKKDSTNDYCDEEY